MTRVPGSKTMLFAPRDSFAGPSGCKTRPPAPQDPFVAPSGCKTRPPAPRDPFMGPSALGKNSTAKNQRQGNVESSGNGRPPQFCQEDQRLGTGILQETGNGRLGIVSWEQSAGNSLLRTAGWERGERNGRTLWLGKSAKKRACNIADSLFFCEDYWI